MLAPAKTPPAVLKRISEAARKALEETALRDRLSDGIMVPAYLDPEAFAKVARTDYDWWGQVVRKYKVHAE